MDTLQPDDFILGIPTKITGGRITVSSRFWSDVDTISVQNTGSVTPTKPFSAKIQQVKSGKATAIPTRIPGSDMASPGEELTLRLKELTDGVYTASTPSIPNLRTVSVPTSDLGAKVKVRIYHIRSRKATAEIVETIREGLKAGHCIGVKPKRGSAICTTNDKRVNSLPIQLNKPAIVGGKASVRLTQTSGKLKGVLEEYGFLPRIRERYAGNVSQGSTDARVSWPEEIDVPSVKLDYPAEATMGATIEITDTGGEVRGRIVEYAIPDVGEEIEIKVKRGNKSAQTRSGSYSVDLEYEPVASGKATAIVKKKSLPLLAEISGYGIISEGDVVGAKIPEGPTKVAQSYSGSYEIILDEEQDSKKYLKVRILKIDESGIYGTVEKVKRDFNSEQQPTNPRNPFATGNSSKNNLLSGRQL